MSGETEGHEAPNASKKIGLKASNALTSQLITVAAGLLAFTVTFAEKFTPQGPTHRAADLLGRCHGSVFGRVLFGFLTLMALNGTFGQWRS
jgi:hypothetical protein